MTQEEARQIAATLLPDFSWYGDALKDRYEEQRDAIAAALLAADRQASEQEQAKSAVLRNAFNAALDSLGRREMPNGCRDLDRDLEKMSPAELRKLLNKWQVMWDTLYKAMCDSDAGVRIIAELETFRQQAKVGQV